MTRKPKILITNDDGIFAPGLRSLWQALVDYADVSIVAPTDDTSGAGAGITIKTPLRVDVVPWENGTRAWKVNGKPADCVKLALGTILTEKPDLIVSGINRGSNSGRTVFCSGTVGGVIEGALRKIPGIAFLACALFVAAAFYFDTHMPMWFQALTMLVMFIGFGAGFLLLRFQHVSM